VPDFAGLKLCADARAAQLGAHVVTVNKLVNRVMVETFGVIGWCGNSGFGALNLAVQFGARRIILVGFDMRVDRGAHWHSDHPIVNPTLLGIERWRRLVDAVAPQLTGLGVRVVNASLDSALLGFPKTTLKGALDG
jgi:hypothetical protein